MSTNPVDPWPPHLAWVRVPDSGPRRELAVDDDDVTCLYHWKAGAALAAMPEIHQLCSGRTVVDLGCGRGSLGLTALASGARRVLFADASGVAIDFITRTIALNCLGDRAFTVQQAWGAPLPEGPWDVILGGDILYRPDYFIALLDTIAGSLAEDGRALLSDPRTVLEANLPILAGQRGLRWQTIRAADMTVVTMTRS